MVLVCMLGVQVYGIDYVYWDSKNETIGVLGHDSAL